MKGTIELEKILDDYLQMNSCEYIIEIFRRQLEKHILKNDNSHYESSRLFMLHTYEVLTRLDDTFPCQENADRYRGSHNWKADSNQARNIEENADKLLKRLNSRRWSPWNYEQ